MKAAWLGLGGNVGDVRANMIKALDAMSETGIDVGKVSPLYETPPWGPIKQARFLNACAELRTTLAPADLLARLHEIEASLQRERTLRWGPRTIDLDLLAYEGFASHEAPLTVPHPRIAERAFVLVPLSDVAPELEIAGVQVEALAAAIERGDMQEVDRNWYPTTNAC